ncbi:hypothetical protein BGZ63DRAFT_360946 [Mariannaea sp. PMI_226]|nr:hypothetical protein BGZ63DRAFT_360946 [Mariannaea sp. PMI_226]
MTDDIDKSLLDRLQALRGGAASSSVRPTPTKISLDPIERRKTPSREDALAARLKSLRDHASVSPSPSPAQGTKPKVADAPVSSRVAQVSAPPKDPRTGEPDDEDIEAIFQTDDQTLEELLSDIPPDEEFHAHSAENDDARVKALLDELAQSIPKDTAGKGEEEEEEGEEDAKDPEIVDSDDSGDEGMKREVDNVIARLRDELELEGSRSQQGTDTPAEDEDEEQPSPSAKPTQDASDIPIPSIETDSDFSLPDLPPTLADLPSLPQSTRSGSTDLMSITARMAALRQSSPSLNLPDVPRDAPSKSKPQSSFKRLTSRTNYTDDDVDSWCNVCLEDATLRCRGCHDDVYCTRCWREMHVGPAAAFDDRSHKAVQFTRDKKEKRKIAVGA